MTHFTIGIILPNEIENIQAYIANVMEPYFEHSNAAPYICYSPEQAAKDLAETIHRLELAISRKEQSYDIDKCREQLASLRAMTAEDKYAEFCKFHDHFNRSGDPISTYNPLSKWDWYVIGGRWDGWINDRKSTQESLAANTALTDVAIARNKIPHAIITPDGYWHEHGRMGWWGILITENDDWEAEARSILAQYPGQNLIIVDAHI